MILKHLKCKIDLVLPTRKILCILMVAEQKINLVRSNGNSSPKLEKCLICKEEKKDSKRILKWKIHFKREVTRSGKPSQLSYLQQIPLHQTI